MLQKSSAWKGFCAEDLQFWSVKWSIQYAETSVLQQLPHKCIFFEKSFRVPKIVPKVVPKIISALALKIIIFIRIKSRHSIVVVLVRFDRVFLFSVL